MPEIVPLTQSGSGRRYFRLKADGCRSAIATIGTDVAENEDFFALQGALLADGINVPGIYAISDDRLCYLQEDLGDVSLFSLLNTNFDIAATIKNCITSLVRLQTGTRTVGTAALIRPSFDERLVMWDLNYFKYCFLKPLELNFNENSLEDDFRLMTHNVSCCDSRLWGFMYRDCQSRNVMVHNNRIYWIDFQGGRPGPMTYDVASLLWQARADFSDSFKLEMTRHYAECAQEIRGIATDDVIKAVYDIVPLRVLQTLGAYGLRGLCQRKSHFLKSIPAAIHSLHSLCRHGVFDAYPELKNIAELLNRHEINSIS